MNKRQSEVVRAVLDDEKHTMKLLEAVYQRASKDCEQKIAELNSRTDMQNLQSIIYQKKYQQALKQQIDGILKDLQSQSSDTASDYLHKCYENGHYGMLYDMQGQGVPLVIPVRQDEVLKALNNDYSNIAKTQRGQSIYRRMGENVDHLRKSVRAEVSRGIANGSSWLDMAVKVTKGMNSPFNAAMRRAKLITRTEGHRVQNQATLDTQLRAKELGADVVKQWDATLDGNTRPWHAEADGQIREIDQKFIVGGEELSAPGIGGSARNVCNCRCVCLQRARWALTGAQTRYLGDVEGMTDKQREAIAKKLGVSEDDLPEISKSIVSINAKDYNEFKKKVKSSEALTLDDFPDFLKLKPSERKNTQLFIDYINSCEGADQRVKGLYKNLGKFASIKNTGGQTKVSHAAGHSLSYSIDSNGDVCNVKLAIPKLTGDNLNGQAGTTLHEVMHYIDLCLRKDTGEEFAHERMYSALDINLQKQFQVKDDTMGDSIKTLFSNFHTELETISTKYREKFKSESDVLRRQVLDGKIPYHEYKKRFSKLKKEVIDGLDYESRNACGGNLGNLEDIYDALSGGNGRDSGKIRYGHGGTYYASTDNRICESIANYASLSITRPDLLELLKDDKPELVKALDGLVDSMAKEVIP